MQFRLNKTNLAALIAAFRKDKLAPAFPEWRAQGYHVSLFFLSLPDAETAIARVAQRVRQGGHDVPEGVIRRRFAAGLRNLDRVYKEVVDTWAVYDNLGDKPNLLQWGENR